MFRSLVGKSIERYQVVEQIGEGGMATVYKARDTRLNRDVALKVIRTEKLTLDTMEKTLKRFQREARALANLTHPNIVAIMDYGEYEGRPFLVMPYISGGTLKERLGHPIPWQEAARLLVPIARALQYAHQQGIIHRDVKPSNVLLGPSGDALLTDFGIAKLLIDTEETSDLTGSGMGIGTPEYMSPEQFQGARVDARTDVYSLGVVFYEMVTGRKPYTANTPGAILVKQATESLPPPSTFVRGLPQDVEATLLRALAKKPEERFADMGGFLRALEDIASGRMPPRDLTGTATVDDSYATAATLQAAGTAYPTVADRDAQPRVAYGPPPAPPRRTSGWIAWALGALGLCAVGALAVIVVAMLASSSGGGASSNPPTSYQPPSSSYQQPTSAPAARPADTSRPTDVPPASPPTWTPVPTPTPSCPGAKYPTRLKADREARVCTKTDRLIVRKSASMSAGETLSIYPGTSVRVLEGPVCADNFWWWKIEIHPGTTYGLQGYSYDQTGVTTQTYTGWAREGWDNVDAYFLCQ